MIDIMFNSGLTIIAVIVYAIVILFLSMGADDLVENFPKNARKYITSSTVVILFVVAIFTCPKVIEWIWS